MTSSSATLGLGRGARAVDLVGMGVALVIVAGLAWCVLGRNMIKMRALREEQRSLTRRLEYAPKIASALGEARVLIADHRGPSGAAESGLPRSFDVEGFLAALTARAQEDRIVLRSVEPQEGAQSPHWGCWAAPVQISAIASFEGIHRFLFEIARMPGHPAALESLLIQRAENPWLCDVNTELLLLAAQPGPFDSSQGSE
ncbi:type 4a pilus biogenesis protein PilO [Candidatus Sumerlaeota bacterium]|nr:type 4a pilus biogenesis protein PilO [Candidatus Sumerlaeota bacterium]